MGFFILYKNWDAQGLGSLHVMPAASASAQQCA
jgi:hypothetical protein